MDKQKIGVIILGITCILLAGATSYEFWQNRELNTELNNRQSALADAQAKNRKLEKQLKAAQKDLAAAKAAAEAAAPKESTPPSEETAPTPEAAPTAPANPDETKKKLGEMMKGPFGEMISKQTVNMMYGDLLKEMVLTPQEREQLNQILVDDSLALTRNSSDTTKDKKQAGAENLERSKATDAKIKALVGEERFAQYQTYKGQIGERMTVKQFEGQLALTQHPLAPDQKKQLIQIMAEEREKYSKESAGKKTDEKMDVVAYQKAINQQVNNRLGTVLMPEQLKEFNKWQESMVQMMGQFSEKNQTAQTGEE